MIAHIDSHASPPGMSDGAQHHKDFPASDHLDTSMLTLIEQLFGQKEFAFLARMLQHATVKQYGLPSQNPAVAQILVPSLATFAQQIGYGKDTVLRHLAVYRALGLLMQSRIDHQTLLSLPLAPYEPHPETTLPALDLLIRTGRPKLQQLARSVKERYQLCYCPTVLIDAHPSASSQESELAMLFLEVQHLLAAKRIPATRRQLLQVRIAAILRRLVPAGKPLLHEGDLVIMAVGTREEERKEQGDRQDRSSSDQGTIAGDEGDLTTRSTVSEDHSLHQGDRQATTTDKQERGVHHEGDRKCSSLSLQGDVLRQQGDLDEKVGVTSEDRSHHQGDQHSLSVSKEGDFSTQRGDRNRTSLSLQEDFRQHEGDRNLDRQRKQTQRGDFSTHQGDFSVQNPSLSINDIENSNNIYIYSQRKNDTFIDSVADQETTEPKRETAPPDPGESNEAIQKEAMALAWFLDQSTDNIASFVKKLKENPMAVRASVIDVLYHEHFPDYRGVPRIRGAWFNRAYKHYQQSNTVFPAEIERWLGSTLSWTEMEEALKQEERQSRASTGNRQSSRSLSESTPTMADDPGPFSEHGAHPVADRSLESQEDTLNQCSGLDAMSAPRSEEERKARRKAARRVREQLQQAGIVLIGRDGNDGLEVDTEHHCGCPLYRHKGLRRSCTHCAPDLSWSPEVRALIASILDV